MLDTHTAALSRTETLRKKLLAQVAACWNAAGFRYSVVHGAEQYPARIGRDIDVMADPASEKAVIATTLSVFRENGWAATAHKMTIGVTRVITHRVENSTIHAAEIDVASTPLQWGPVVFLDVPSPEAECMRRGPFVVDLWGSFVKGILIQALSGNFQRFEQRPEEICFFSDQGAIIAEKRLAEFANATLASDFVDAVEAKDLSRLRVCSRALRVALLRESLRGHRLAGTVHGTLAWIRNRLRLNVFVRKAAPIVALVGPERIDKHAILEVMRPSMRHELVFPEMLVRHWPSGLGLAPDIADSTPDTCNVSAAPAQGVSPRSERSAWMDGAHLARCMLSYLSTYVKDRKCSADLLLVVYDQWLLDTLVHAIPRRLSFGGMCAILRLLPRPDLVILLHDDLVDTGPQCAAPSGRIAPLPKVWHKLAEQGYIDVLLKADAPPAEVAHRIIRAVVDTFFEMHGGKELCEESMHLE